MVFCCSSSESDWNWKWNVDSQKCIVLSALRRKRLPQFSLSESFSSWKKLDFFHAVFICQCLNPCCPDLGLPSWAGWWFWQLACHFQTGFGVWEPQGNKLIHRSQNWQIMELKVQNKSLLLQVEHADLHQSVLFPPQLLQCDYWISSIWRRERESKHSGPTFWPENVIL